MNNKGVHIKDVLPQSIAEELGIQKGDKILSINGVIIRDILEYKYIITDEYLELEIEKPDGECWVYEVDKEYDEDLGILFEGIIDNPKSCHNKCIFCFIDQLPKGMRETLYFKDDDTRLSFLQGNFVTLTNLKESEIDSIIKYRISPINVSVHTTDPDLRVKMLNNKNAGKILKYLKKLVSHNIEIKAQIVLCPKVNDGEYLSSTVNDLMKLYPNLSCTAIVPAGLTKFREGLYPIEEVSATEANKVIALVELLQQSCLRKLGTRFVFLSDEFYLIAGRELPKYEEYEDFMQLENGVGLITLLREEIKNSLDNLSTDYNKKDRHISIITGEYAEPFLKEAAYDIEQKIQNLKLDVIAIKNDFFGHGVKVSGLITGVDIINRLKGQNISSVIFIPDSMLRDGDTVFLDDISIFDIEKELKVKVVILKQDGSDLIQRILEQ